VSPSVTGYEQNRLIRKRPENLSAWEEYLQGLRCFHEREHTDHEDLGLTQARQHFQKAIELDPALSDAHAYLSICGAWELIYFTARDPEQTLNTMLTDGRTAHLLRGDHSTAYEHAQRAVKFNPSFALSYLWLGGAQVHSGDYEQGESTILKAFELSPADPELNIFHAVLYFAYLGQGKYEEALEAIEKALLEHPDAGHHLGFRAAVLGHLERSSEAKAALDHYLTLRPNLKTRDDYRRIFIPNSGLADPIIEGLVKAGWEPEE
jgi:tetratricopeptide (TPR) repeat protein